MGVTNYYTVGGLVIGEKRSGSSRRDYVRDGSGDTRRVIDQSKTSLFSASYEPYGAVASAIGQAPTFSWKGAWGYAQTGGSIASVYVRARHYSVQASRWCTVDAFWPLEPAYAYVRGNPTSRVDPSGLQGLQEQLQQTLSNPPPISPEEARALMEALQGAASGGALWHARGLGMRATVTSYIYLSGASGAPVVTFGPVLIIAAGAYAVYDLYNYAASGGEKQGVLTTAGDFYGKLLAENSTDAFEHEELTKVSAEEKYRKRMLRYRQERLTSDRARQAIHAVLEADKAKGSDCDKPRDERILYRYHLGPETRASMEADARKSSKAPDRRHGGFHPWGLSTNLKRHNNAWNRPQLFRIVEAVWSVKQTGKDIKHHDVCIDQPVTELTAAKWNILFDPARAIPPLPKE